MRVQTPAATLAPRPQGGGRCVARASRGASKGCHQSVTSLSSNARQFRQKPQEWNLEFIQCQANAGGDGRRRRLRRRRAGGRHFRRRRHVPISRLLEMGRRLPAEDWHRTQLSVDRFRRRHQADQGEDRHVRRLGHAPEARGAAGSRTGAVPDDHRRRGAGGEREGCARRPAGARRRHCGGHLPGRYHQVERRAHQEAQSEAPAPRRHDRAGVPLRWLRHQLPVLRLPVEIEPEVPAERGGQHLGAMAGGHRRQG